jgi:hypothetical protein
MQEKYYLLEGDSVHYSSYVLTHISAEISVSVFTLNMETTGSSEKLLPSFFTLEMEAEGFFGIFVNIYQIPRCHIPED